MKRFFLIFFLFLLCPPLFSLNLAPLSPLLPLNNEEAVKIDPDMQSVIISPDSSGYFQPVMQIPDEDVGKKAKLLMLIKIPDESKSFLLPVRSVILEKMQKFENISEIIDFDKLSGATFDVYFGYEIDSNIRYNFYRLVISPKNIQVDNFYNFPINKVITVKFDKEIEIISKEKDNSSKDIPPGIENLTEINEFSYLKVQFYDNGSQVNGKLYVSSDKKQLIFIPEQFLLPDKNYKVIISKNIQFNDNESLGKDIILAFKTKSSNNMVKISSPLSSKTYKDINISWSTSAKLWHSKMKIVKGSFVEKSFDDIDNISYSFEDSGIYYINLTITDIYGREYKIVRMINILPDIKQKFENRDDLELTNVENIKIDNIKNNDFRNFLNNYSKSLLSVVEGNLLYDNGSYSNDKIIAFSIYPEKINKFLFDYIKHNIDLNKFLGIVSLSGFPAILTYETSDFYNLNILMFDNGLEINNFNYKDYNINCSFYDTTPSHILYFYSFEVDNDTLSNLKEYLPKNIDNFMPVLATEEDNVSLYLYVSDNNSSFAWSLSCSYCSHVYHKAKHIVKKVIHHAKKEIKKTVQNIFKLTNLISHDLINMLKDLEGFISNASKINISYLNDIKQTSENLKTSFNSASTTVKNVESYITPTTDPDRFFKSALGLVDKNVNNNPVIKNFVDNTMNYINKAGNSIKFFANISKNILHKNIDFNEDEAVAFYIDSKKDAYLYLKKGNKHYNISLKTLMEMSEHIKVVKTILGDNFPLNNIVDILKNIEDNFPAPAMLGFFYNGAGDHFTKFLLKYSKINDEKCSEDESSGFCFGTYASTALSKENLEIAINTSDDDGFLVKFSPLAPVLPEITGADKIYDFIQKDIALFPELSFNLRIRDGDGKFELEGSTFPEVELEGIGEIGVDFNYYEIFGGKGGAGIELGIMLNINEIKKIGTEVLLDIIKSAFNSAKIVISGEIEIDNNSSTSKDNSSVSTYKFQSDGAFAIFINSFIANLIEELKKHDYTDLSKGILFKLGVQGSLGLGVGEGGTGTGGISSNLGIGINSGLVTNLYLFQQFIKYIVDNDIDIFILTPYHRMGQLFNNAQDDFKNISTNSIASQSVNLLQDTFTSMIDTAESAGKGAIDTVKKLFELLADNFFFYISLPGSGNVIAEEQAEIKIKLVTGPKIAINTETLFNIIYAFLYSLTPDNKRYYAPFFDHKGIYPTIDVTWPVAGMVSGGIGEGIELQLEGGAKTNFFKGTFTYVNDPSVNSNGVKFLPPISVNLTTDKKNLSLHNNATIKCNVKLNDNSNVYLVHWFINGKKISSSGAFSIDGKQVVNIKSYSKEKLELENFKISGKYNISVKVESYKSKWTDFPPQEVLEKENETFSSITLNLL